MCSLTICIYSFVKVCSSLLSIFIGFFGLLIDLQDIYIYISPLSDICHKHFSQYMTCIFVFLITTFVKSNVSFSWKVIAFYVLSKKCLPIFPVLGGSAIFCSRIDLDFIYPIVLVLFVERLFFPHCFIFFFSRLFWLFCVVLIFTLILE